MARASPCVRWSTMATVCGFARSKGAAPAGNWVFSLLTHCRLIVHAIENFDNLTIGLTVCSEHRHTHAHLCFKIYQN